MNIDPDAGTPGAPSPYPPPRFIAGRLCVDFVNTVGAREPEPSVGGGVLRDKLGSYGDLLAWSGMAATIGPDEGERLAAWAAAHPAEGRRVLARALGLREALHRLFKALLAGAPHDETDLHTLNDEIHRASTRRRLVRDGARFGWEWDAEPEPLALPLARVALDAAAFLVAPDLARLRECRGEACGWMFVDLSPAGRRQWCDMRDCGNLAKVRRFRARRKTA